MNPLLAQTAASSADWAVLVERLGFPIVLLIVIGMALRYAFKTGWIRSPTELEAKDREVAAGIAREVGLKTERDTLINQYNTVVVPLLYGAAESNASTTKITERQIAMMEKVETTLRDVQESLRVIERLGKT